MDCHCTGHKGQHLLCCVCKGQGERTKRPPLPSLLGPGRDQGCLQKSGSALPGTRRNPSPQHGSNTKMQANTETSNQPSTNNTSSPKTRKNLELERTRSLFTVRLRHDDGHNASHYARPKGHCQVRSALSPCVTLSIKRNTQSATLHATRTFQAHSRHGRSTPRFQMGVQGKDKTLTHRARHSRARDGVQKLLLIQSHVSADRVGTVRVR